MSDRVAVPLESFATIRESGPVGMITLRARPDLAALPGAVRAATGLALPAQRRIVRVADRAVGWMSPDEWLIVLPPSDVEAAISHLEQGLAGHHVLIADVSDARATFRIDGPGAVEVLMKLCPADVANLPPDALCRTRAAQVACAFWRDGGGYTLVSFRSVAGYVRDLLTHAALPGSGLGLR